MIARAAIRGLMLTALLGLIPAATAAPEPAAVLQRATARPVAPAESARPAAAESVVPAAESSARPTADVCVTQALPPAVAGAPPAFRDCANTPVMVPVPEGWFMMGDSLGTGSEYERPVHHVTIKKYAIARYETTRAEWNACHKGGYCADPREREGDNAQPISSVTWEEARRYVDWLSKRTGHRYRLPSEAEWEYAARAGTVTPYSWGKWSDDVCKHANAFDISGNKANPQWFWQSDCDDGFAKSAPVGRFPSNAWGIYDMSGNVWEWVEDCWHSDFTDAPIDGSAWTEPDCRKRVNRGGGWGNPATALRVTSRDGDPANAHSDGLGFRVVRELSP